jgi:hypothetical protein
MPTLRCSLIAVVIAGSIAIPCTIHQRGQARFRRQNQELQQQAAELAELSAENKRLSDLVAQTGSTSAPNDAERELLRLRSEIGQLRQVVDEANKIRSQNQQLLAGKVGALQQSNTTSPPDPQTVLAYWPRPQLAAAGYDNPSAALQTTLFAVSKGDADALLASVTPEAKVKMTRENWFIHRAPAEEVADSTKQMAESLNPSTGFYLVGQNFLTQDRAILDVYFDGEGRTRKVAMRRVGDAWKFDSLGNGAWP